MRVAMKSVIIIQVLFVVLLLTLTSAPNGFGEDSGKRNRATSSGSSKSNPGFMWEIKGLKNTVYVMGEIKASPKDMFPLPRGIEAAFERSPVLVLENSPGNSPPEMEDWIQKNGLYPDGQRLSDHIRPTMVNLIKAKRLPLDQIERTKPWLVAVQLEVLHNKSCGFDSNNSVVSHFIRKGQGRKKILELIGFPEEKSVIENLTDDDQELWLLKSLLDLDRKSEWLSRMIKAWKAGDADRFYEIALNENQRLDLFAPLLEKTMFQQNIKSVEKIEILLGSDHNYFILLDAASLVGPKGILALLEAKGYPVMKSK